MTQQKRLTEEFEVDAAGYRIVEIWDTLGMHATKSEDVVLEGALIPDHYVSRMVAPGGADAFVLSMFAWFLIGAANIYYGIAQRAADIAIPAARAKTSISLTRSMAYHPGIQQAAADMTLLLEPIGPHVEQIAQEWSISTAPAMLAHRIQSR